jgi:hypothetical protein
MQRERERSSFGGTYAGCGWREGFPFVKLVGACSQAAKQLRFDSHSPEHHQLVRYEAGRLGAHPHTVRVIAAALGVPLTELEPSVTHLPRARVRGRIGTRIVSALRPISPPGQCRSQSKISS